MEVKECKQRKMTERERERDSENEEKTALQKAYEVFDLEEDASFQEVIKKYKKLSLTYHPDSRSSITSRITPEEKIAKFQEISNAYTTITRSFLSEAQKNQEKDETIEELRTNLAQSGTSNYYYVAALEELNKQFTINFYGVRISSILVCCFFYFRRNKEEKENNKIVLALIKYFLLTAIFWPLTPIVLIWDIVAYFIKKKDPKKEN
jgi:DnaJ-class molecular chaperone